MKDADDRLNFGRDQRGLMGCNYKKGKCKTF